MKVWTELEGEARYFFQTAAWVKLATAANHRALAWNATYAQGRGVFVAALSVRRFGAGFLACRVLREFRPIFQGPPMFDGLLASRSDSQVQLSFSEAMRQFGRWHVVALRGMRAESPWLSLRGADGFVEADPNGGVAIFDTSTPFEERWHSVPHRIRKVVRRGRQKMGDRGRTAVATGAAVGEAFDDFVKLEGSGWKGREGTALLQMAPERQLLRDYMTSCQSAEVRTLLVDGVPAAALISIAFNRTRVVFKTAYNEEMSELAPGNVIMADLIESCCNDPAVDRVDTVVWQPYYHDWGMVREPTYKLTAFNTRTLWGLLARTCWQNKDTIRSILGALKQVSFLRRKAS